MFPLFYNFNYMIFMLPAMLLMMAAQWYVSSSYRRWSRVLARSQMTGAQAAQRLMQSAGLFDVRLEGIPGNMTDHYDPRSKTLRLSQGTANSPSVAALAIAAHELGHALQDKEGYLPLKLRGAIVPAVNIGSYLGWILIIAGLFLNATNLAVVGLIFFSGGAVFALATLPVELDASARARVLLANAGIIRGEDEQRGVNTVLNAAALTYVAALVTAVLQLLYFANLVFGRRR
ncbi:MAG TPA: zinc metallopeptidase [Anaerolineales bacterium]|nr:zinc metallopeptidase [Anaerolineales bacterium]